MRCPSCGMELPEGKLYCEQCGEEIHIVPDFEPEVEITIAESLGQVLESAFEKQIPKKQQEKKKHSRLNIAVAILIICSIIVIGFAFYFMEHSEDFQIGRGNHFYEKGNLTRATYNYEKALMINPENISVKLSLAYCYRDMGEMDAFESMLEEVIYSADVTENELITAYSYLISYFLEENDYEKIDKILTGCNNEYVIKNYSEYMVWEPEPSYSAGYYNEIIPLKLSSKSKGTIYYTTDGSKPDTNSPVYTGETIFLSGGQTHTVKAILVSEYGVISDCVTAVYEIEVQKPSPPEVFPLSGEYTVAEPIVIELEDYEKVYYTTDGSVPTTSSYQYKGSLLMNNGYTLYRFIMVDEDGIASDYTEREYIVTINETPLPGVN